MVHGWLFGGSRGAEDSKADSQLGAAKHTVRCAASDQSVWQRERTIVQLGPATGKRIVCMLSNNKDAGLGGEAGAEASRTPQREEEDSGVGMQGT
jgi:hypothetical protein